MMRVPLLILLLINLAQCSTPGTDATKNDRLGDQKSESEIAFDSSAQISEYIVNIYEDKSGNLWFGTMSDGTPMYDGKSLKYFTTADGLINNTVAGIIEDTAGRMWFGTHAGASCYDPSTPPGTGGKSFTNYGAKQGLHGGACKFLVDKKGTLWAATYDGVFQFNGKSFVEFILPKPEVEAQSYKFSVGAVWRIMQDSKGNIWFGRDTYGACRFDGKTFTHYTKKDGLCSNNVSRIEEDKQGNIWFGCLSSDFPTTTQDGGVCRLDSGGSKILQFTETAGLTQNDIYGIYCDNSGNVWISAGGVGVYRYSNNTFTLFKETDRPDLIPKFYVQGFLEDSKGNLWFGFSGGLFRFDGKSFVNVTQGSISQNQR
jgi:ligand-binding sensor domain-containing protein